jgi:hypothetical protein
VDTDMSRSLEVPKATPESVARRQHAVGGRSRSVAPLDDQCAMNSRSTQTHDPKRLSTQAVTALTSPATDPHALKSKAS